jgi:hypothetical protein
MCLKHHSYDSAKNLEPYQLTKNPELFCWMTVYTTVPTTCSVVVATKQRQKSAHGGGPQRGGRVHSLIGWAHYRPPLTSTAQANIVLELLRSEVAGDTLALTVGPRRVRMVLRPWNRDTFLVSWPETDAYLGASGWATFALGPRGRPVSLTLDPFADVDKGMFVRAESTRTPSP